MDTLAHVEPCTKYDGVFHEMQAVDAEGAVVGGGISGGACQLEGGVDESSPLESSVVHWRLQ